MRRAEPADTGALVAFYADVFTWHGQPGPNVFFAEYVRDLLRTTRPPYGPDNFTIVEDTRRGAIVSSLNLISQQWSYDGIDFGVGRIEPVGTSPDYRRRGLVRRQFEMAHRWSAERGELVQVITGIPYFYRQFGYEYTIEMNSSRRGSVAAVPTLKEGETEPYRVRPAKEGDLAFIAALYEAASRRYLVTCRRDAQQWQHELTGRHWMSQNCRRLRVIETPTGKSVGYIAECTRLWSATFSCDSIELVPGLSYGAVMPSVLRHLLAAGRDLIGKTPDSDALYTVALCLGDDHPAYAALPGGFVPYDRHYAFYVRVPDVPAFLRHIAPVLERRLADSPFVGHSGELKLTFYRGGVRLVFDQGRLASCDAWRPDSGDDPNAGFPELTFLKLLFGYRDFTEIRYLFPDVWADDDTRGLLAALFPKQPSAVWPIG